MHHYTLFLTFSNRSYVVNISYGITMHMVLRIGGIHSIAGRRNTSTDYVHVQHVQRF